MLLINEAIGCPHALFVVIRRIDELDIVAYHTQHAEMRFDGRRNALKAFEELLHLLLFARLSVLVRRIEFVLREAAV
jgi:hypothetical protein